MSLVGLVEIVVLDACGKAQRVGDGGAASGGIDRGVDGVGEGIGGLDQVAGGVVLKFGFIADGIGACSTWPRAL